MAKSAEELVSSAKRLPPSERAALIEALLDSMDAPDAVVDERWVEEAESRTKAFDAGDLESIDAEVVVSRLTK